MSGGHVIGYDLSTHSSGDSQMTYTGMSIRDSKIYPKLKTQKYR